MSVPAGRVWSILWSTAGSFGALPFPTEFGVVRIACMTTAEAIYERALALPESLRREALHYLEYLLQRRDAAGQPAADDEAAWTRLSAEQLAAHYGPDDSVYDSP